MPSHAVKVGDVIFNTQQIEDLIAQAEGKGVEMITFPELSITGYSCQDLFRQQMLLESSEQAVMMLLDFTRKLDIISIVGAPVVAGDLLLNCGIVIQHGQILGIVPKTYLPNYSEFYEKRWFASAQDLERLRSPLCRTQGEADSGCADFPYLRRRAVWCGDMRGCMGSCSS